MLPGGGTTAGQSGAAEARGDAASRPSQAALRRRSLHFGGRMGDASPHSILQRRMLLRDFTAPAAEAAQFDDVYYRKIQPPIRQILISRRR